MSVNAPSGMVPVGWVNGRELRYLIAGREGDGLLPLASVVVAAELEGGAAPALM